jgi:hypothetical protein
METIFSIMVSLMVRVSQQSTFSATTTGSYYEITEMRYDPKVDETYTIYSRYVKGSESDTLGQHFHVEINKGKITKDQAYQDALTKVDPGIQVIVK